MNDHPGQQLTTEEALALLKQLILPDAQLPFNPTVQQLKLLLCARKRSLDTGDRSIDTLLLQEGGQVGDGLGLSWQ